MRRLKSICAFFRKNWIATIVVVIALALAFFISPRFKKSKASEEPKKQELATLDSADKTFNVWLKGEEGKFAEPKSHSIPKSIKFIIVAPMKNHASIGKPRKVGNKVVMENVDLINVIRFRTSCGDTSEVYGLHPKLLTEIPWECEVNGTIEVLLPRSDKYYTIRQSGRNARRDVLTLGVLFSAHPTLGAGPPQKTHSSQAGEMAGEVADRVTEVVDKFLDVSDSSREVLGNLKPERPEEPKNSENAAKSIGESLGKFQKALKDPKNHTPPDDFKPLTTEIQKNWKKGEKIYEEWFKDPLLNKPDSKKATEETVWKKAAKENPLTVEDIVGE